MKLKTILTRILQLLPLLLFGIALAVVHHEMKNHEFHALLVTLKHVPARLLALAFGWTILNYLVLMGYDWLALRYTGHKNIAPRRIALASLIGYGISNNTGHAWASGGSIRYRFYTNWGVPGWDVVKISLFLGMTYAVGILTLGFIGTLALPHAVRATLERPQIIDGLAVLCGALLCFYWAAIIFWRKTVTIKDMVLEMPSLSMALGQTALACLDLILASLVLWVFLKDVPGMNFEVFLIIYMIAQVAGLLSQVPGGLGVFEGSFLWLATPLFSNFHPALVAALVFYRIIYFFAPLAIAGIALLAHEIYVSRTHVAKAGHLIGKTMLATVPQIFSILLIFTGAILLVSGATPATPSHIKWLRDFVPLPAIEFSHLIGSLVGVLLLFLARGIRLRIDAAWYGSLILLGLGVFASLFKGFDWREADFLCIMFVAMLLSRRFFRRKSSLLKISLDPAWLVTIGIVLLGSIWIGFFAYKHVEYSDNLWWQFSYRNDASRFLRSLIVIAVVIVAVSLMKLLSVAKPKALPKASPEDLQKALPLVGQAKDPQAYLALLGDKSLFWAENEGAFLSYAATPKYWIAMGDPVGDPKEFENLLWNFREEADHVGAKAVFYQVREHHLPLYLDLGLVLLKTGQEAKLNLTDFTLSGKKRDDFRTSRNKLTKLSYSFRILNSEEVAAHVPRLREISDLWIARKNAQEKRFSLGFFDEAYLSRTRVAIVCAPDGKIMAFANLWEAGDKAELAIDLMRYDPESPGGIMDYLFAELMLWGREENFQKFSLGMAPLSGLERRPLAPLWHKIGTAIYDMGEEFYNFEGLFEYKAKFGPDWHARYLAAPAGLSVPLIIMSVARLVAGGRIALLKK